MVMSRDFMMRQGLAGKVNNQMQFEFFNQSTSLGMEGITVYLRHPGRKEYETVFFPVLSTEGCQDGRVVYSNTEMVLSQVADYLEEQRDIGSDVGAIISDVEDVKLEELLDNTDGCAETYRCGTALFMLWKIAKEREIVYDYSIDPSGHGKKEIDGYGAETKYTLEDELCGKRC